MPSRRVRNRLDRIPTISGVAFAAGEVVVEAIRRSVAAPRGGVFQPGTEALGPLFRRDCRYVGWEVQCRGGTMLDADRTLDAERAERRCAIARRQELCDALYDEMVEVRRAVEGFLGRRQGREYLRGLGPTSRAPLELCAQASELRGYLSDPETAPRPAIVFVRPDWAARARALEEKRVALDGAIRAACEAARGVQVALRDQRRAIAAFDEIYGKGARYLEAQLEMLGLPSLAAAVRPGVGRRGRPRKTPEVDVYPDLVERALRLAGLSRPGLSRPDLDVTEAKAADEPAETVTEGSQEDLPDAQKGASEAPDADLKIEQALRKQRRPRRIIVHGLRKHPAGLQKSRQGLRKLPDGPPKREQGRRKLGHIHVNAEESTFGAGRPAVASSRLRQLRETASAWWGRMRPAA